MFFYIIHYFPEEGRKFINGTKSSIVEIRKCKETGENLIALLCAERGK